MPAYSHVIVGAGSAGCALAYRLTEDPTARVLLLEAGGWDRDPHIRELASADPVAAPRIIGNYLATERDRATLRAGLRIARDVGRQAALRPFIAKETAPGPDDWSDAGLDTHIAATGITVHHPIGTCRMGRADDPDTVVDTNLRVLGTEQLRVIDASIFPDLIGGNVNAAVIMIAEKAADLLRGRALLPPAAV